MKIALQWMGMILAIVLALVAAFAMVMGATVNHSDKMTSWGGFGLVAGIILISLLRIIWTGNKHKHQNAVQHRVQSK